MQKMKDRWKQFKDKHEDTIPVLLIMAGSFAVGVAGTLIYREMEELDGKQLVGVKTLDDENGNVKVIVAKTKNGDRHHFTRPEPIVVEE